MATSKGDSPKKPQPKDEKREDQQPAEAERSPIQEEADRVLDGSATVVNTTGSEPQERSGPVNQK